jgi:hypothetical protein
VGKGFFSVSKTTDCIIIIQMDFRGAADEWEAWCRKVVLL